MYKISKTVYNIIAMNVSIGCCWSNKALAEDLASVRTAFGGVDVRLQGSNGSSLGRDARKWGI